jgi:hypothetical protein
MFMAKPGAVKGKKAIRVVSMVAHSRDVLRDKLKAVKETPAAGSAPANTSSPPTGKGTK